MTPERRVATVQPLAHFTPVNEKQLQALIRKTMAKAEKTSKKPGSWADPTLSATQSPERDDDDAQKIFKEMKKREF
jgi:hypothetical protein